MTTDLPTVPVLLLQTPVALWQRSSTHTEVVQRELDIVTADLGSDSAPNRLVQIVQDIDIRFGRFGATATAALQEAAARGDERVDLELDVPADIIAATRDLLETMDLVDDYCRDGERLLTLATPPDLVAFRVWVLEELSRQIEQGLDPSPWPGSDHDTSPTGPPERPGASPGGPSHRIRFEGDLDLATAGGLREEILSARSAGAVDLTIDLTAVEFMDSVGLSLLVTAFQRMTEEGLTMRIVLPEQLRVLFDIAGLTDVLHPEFVVVDRR